MYILCRYIDLAIGGMPLEAHNQPVPHASIPLNAAEDAYAAALGDGNLDVAAAIPAPGGVVPAPATLLAPHGRLWTAVDAVPVDAGMNHPQRTTTFNFGHEYHEPKTALEYFMMMYPIATINGTLAGTTNNLRTFNRGNALTKGEWLRFLGYMYLIALNQARGSYADLWKAEGREGSYKPAMDFGKYGLSKNRFENLRASLALNEHPQPVGHQVCICPP